MSQSSALDADASLVDELLGAARAAWPGVALEREAFVAHLAHHLPEGVPVDDAVRAMCSIDLYLACACARGDARALQAFDDQILTIVDGTLGRRGHAADVITEVKQRIRHRVLVAEGTAPRIAAFSGRGDLRGWVRTIAIREALLLEERARREAPLDEEALLHAFVAPGDPEIDHLKRHYRDEFRAAFDAALHALPARAKTILRQHAIDGLSIDELGAIYQVHRATAARTLERARAAVLAGTRARMSERLRVDSMELDSILRLIRSRLEVSLRGLLAPRESREP